MKAYVITVHGIATDGKWQDDISTAYAPHFECLTVRYPHYRRLGALNLLQEPLVLVPALIATAVLAFRIPGYPSGMEWLAVTVFVLAAYLATYYRRIRAFNRVLEQASPHAGWNAMVAIIKDSRAESAAGRLDESSIVKSPCAGSD